MVFISATLGYPNVCIAMYLSQLTLDKLLYISESIRDFAAHILVG